MIILITLISIIIYAVSIYYSRLYYMKMYFHEQGNCYFIAHFHYDNARPGLHELVVSFFPVINTLKALGILTGSWKDDKYRKEFKFFKIK